MLAEDNSSILHWTLKVVQQNTDIVTFMNKLTDVLILYKTRLAACGWELNPILGLK